MRGRRSVSESGSETDRKGRRGGARRRLASFAAARRPRPERAQDAEADRRVPLCHRHGNRGRLEVQGGLHRPGRGEERQGDRRPRRRRDERFRVRRERRGVPPDRGQLRPGPSRAVASRRSAQCRRRRPEPGWQRAAGDRARHRGRPHLPAADQVFIRNESRLPGRGRNGEAFRDGLLRNRRHARGRRRDRAEQRRARHRLSGADRAFRRLPGADRLSEERRRARGGRSPARRAGAGGDRRADG